MGFQLELIEIEIEILISHMRNKGHRGESFIITIDNWAVYKVLPKDSSFSSAIISTKAIDHKTF